MALIANCGFEKILPNTYIFFLLGPESIYYLFIGKHYIIEERLLILLQIYCRVHEITFMLNVSLNLL